MSVKYRVVLKKDMTKGAAKEARKYYGSISSSGTMGIEQICSNIASYSTASPGDVRLVIDGLVFMMTEALLRGEVVQLGELGNFQLKMSSKGVDDAADYDSSMLSKPRILFRPSIRLKSAIARVSVEKWPIHAVPDAGKGGSGNEGGSEDGGEDIPGGV